MSLNVILISAILVVFSTCNQPNSTDADHSTQAPMDTTTHKPDLPAGSHNNQLVNETSPYLLQHAHNPVNWYPWGDQALDKARQENKLIIVSIGYSACHWCHVMEHESFEDEAVAALMNENFISIKVDREERPDVDQIYMDAVHLMGQRGGWPLNCFATPEGKPFFGGTYFPKANWMDLLGKVSEEWKNNPDNIIEYADRLTQGIQATGLPELNTEKPDFDMAVLDQTVEEWAKRFDNKEGGPDRAPKFPIPNNYEFLIKYAKLNDRSDIFDHVKLTLDKMAFGGIYDQLGGGFARYSTDGMWKVPHFEKMLYDNAQLVSLYSEAYRATKDPLYKKVVDETLQYIKREMTAPEGAFYSALDADSEGEEGKFYVWSKEELKELLGEGYSLFSDYYNVNNTGFWEHGNYILLRKKTDEEIAKAIGITTDQLNEKMNAAKKKLMTARDKRVRPGLDDKSLTSWNALMLKAYTDAYLVFNEKEFLQAALNNADFILKNQRRKDGGLNHSYKKGRSTINGYLEDYCFTIEAFLGLYEATFDEKWLKEARLLADYAITHFHSKDRGMFWFTSNLDQELIARKMEITDNVIPASNSSMAKGLFLLGHYYDNKEYLDMSEQMLNNVKSQISSYGSGYSNWSILMLRHAKPFYEIAISGKQALEKRTEFNRHYLPNRLFVGSASDSKLPLLENKLVKGETRIYVCLNKTCQLPVTEVSEALKQID